MKNLAGIKVMILGDESGAIRAMTEVDKRAGRLGTSLQSTGKMMIGLGTGVVTALAAGTLAMGNNAEEIMKQAQQVGMSAEDYQRFRFSVEQAGGSAENLTKGMTILRQASVNAVGGNKTAIAAFHELNIEYKNTDGTARNTKDIILDLSEALAKGSKSPEQMAAALTLLGRRGGKELVMWLLEGREAILATAAAAPGVIPEATLIRLKDFQDRVKGMKTALTGLLSVGLAPLIPYFDKAINRVMNLADKFEQLSPESKQQIGQFILLGSVALIAGGGLAFMVGKISAVVQAARGLKSMGTFLSGVNPQILLVVAGLMAIWWGLGKIQESLNWVAAKGAQEAFGKEADRLRKDYKSGKITKEQFGEGFRTPDMLRRAKLITQAETGDMRPEWAPGKVMESASKGIGLMMGDVMNKYLPGQTPAPVVPALAGVPTTPSIFGGVAAMPLPAFGANLSTAQTGKTVYVNFQGKFDTTADGVQAMADQVESNMD